MTDLADLTIAEAKQGLRAGEFSAVELTEAALRRAAITEAHLHAFSVPRPGRGPRGGGCGRCGPRRRRRSGPLHGIPIAIKDNMCTRGLETTCSSKILAGYVPPYDATAVARLREPGP